MFSAAGLRSDWKSEIWDEHRPNSLGKLYFNCRHASTGRGNCDE